MADANDLKSYPPRVATTPTPSEAPQPAPAAADGSSGAEPSGYTGGIPSTAGPGPTAVKSATPENREGRLDPSAPEGSNTTPGTTGTK